jgi:hypothetical protein
MRSSFLLIIDTLFTITLNYSKFRFRSFSSSSSSYFQNTYKFSPCGFDLGLIELLLHRDPTLRVANNCITSLNPQEELVERGTQVEELIAIPLADSNLTRMVQVSSSFSLAVRDELMCLLW